MNCKKAIVAFILILLFPAIITVSYFCSFEIIKGVDINIFNLYASNGASTENPYLNDEVFQNVAVKDAIDQVLKKSANELTTTQEAYRFLLKNKESVTTTVLQNDEYE